MNKETFNIFFLVLTNKLLTICSLTMKSKEIQNKLCVLIPSFTRLGILKGMTSYAELKLALVGGFGKGPKEDKKSFFM